MTSNAPIRLALVGAGVFAHEAHLPALLNLQDRYELVAIYSRSRANADRLAHRIPHPVDVTDDLDSLLARDDIEAVDIVVPINALPGTVEQALRAGKHVISEKPVSPTVAVGRQLLDVPRRGVWMVAENWRYVQSYQEAAKLVRSGELGMPILCQWFVALALAPGNKYYETDWRRSGDFPGGFLLDAGVHYVAALRDVMGNVASVGAHASQVRPDLPPLDTVAASLEFESGALGAFGMTFAGCSGGDPVLRVIGEQGYVDIKRESLSVTRSGQTRLLTFRDEGVREELRAFADAVREGAPHRNSPEQALQDVAIIEAMFQSAEAGQRVAVERFV